VNEEFIKSVGNIRTTSHDMLKNLRAVKGENYTRVVHAIILSDQLDSVLEVFSASAVGGSQNLAEEISTAGSKMITRIMDYYIKATGLTEQQIKEAFEDATRIQNNTTGLVRKAREMSERGQVMGE